MKAPRKLWHILKKQRYLLLFLLFTSILFSGMWAWEQSVVRDTCESSNGGILSDAEPTATGSSDGGLAPAETAATESMEWADTAAYIEISSENKIYALARILASGKTKDAFFGAAYFPEADLEQFAFPDEITDTSAKIEYLAAAAYQLTCDISLNLQQPDNTSFFTGIGSEEFPFKGIFNGNGKTITLHTTGNLSLNADTDHAVGLFGTAEGAKFINTNVVVADDLLVNKSTANTYIGSLVGLARDCHIVNCTATISNAKIGVDYANGEEDSCTSRVGGLVGECQYTLIQDCNVRLENGTVYAKGYTVKSKEIYAHCSVGGILGFSQAGSDNLTNIGQTGNELRNCHVFSDNTRQQDVIFVSVETGEEVTAGGLVGCSFNNFSATNCSVSISNGNIVAEKTGTTDTGTYGAQAGGIIGRLEHTGELCSCNVVGNSLTILARSAENYSTAGGIAGTDVGPYHKDIVSISNCSFAGNETSRIILDISADDTVNKWNALGGIVGYGAYQVVSCNVTDVALVNESVDVEKCFVGGIGGIFGKHSGFWQREEFFTPKEAGIRDSVPSNVSFNISRNVRADGICALYQ